MLLFADYGTKFDLPFFHLGSFAGCFAPFFGLGFRVWALVDLQSKPHYSTRVLAAISIILTAVPLLLLDFGFHWLTAVYWLILILSLFVFWKTFRGRKVAGSHHETRR